MKKTILQEVKAINKIAGTKITKQQEIALIKERLQNLNEATGPYYSTGYEAGGNGKTGKLDKTTPEGKYIAAKINQLYTLINDKKLLDFTEGYVKSMATSVLRFDGINSVPKVLLQIREKNK
jgi:hypothetical protein